ncbi:MAG: hypothetical protein JRI49_07170 [Deltaproteobacteria bacterium]|nr:hypothetical protein [Deltaproteobacteria bacterium]
MSEKLLKKLRKNSPKYSITGKRAREIAVKTPGIKVVIKTRVGKSPKKCPVCSNRLKKTYTKNLKGKNIILKLSCTKCSYRGKSGKWIPSRYEFIRK